MDHGRCQLCGAPLEDESEYCSECGTHRTLPNYLFDIVKAPWLDRIAVPRPSRRVTLALAALPLLALLIAKLAVAPAVIDQPAEPQSPQLSIGAQDRIRSVLALTPPPAQDDAGNKASALKEMLRAPRRARASLARGSKSSAGKRSPGRVAELFSRFASPL